MAMTITLPAVETGGNGGTDYSLVGPNMSDLSELPGMTFDPRTRILSGTPTAMPAAAMTFTYTAMDSDNNVMTADAAVIAFAISITQRDPTGIVLTVEPAEVTESSTATDVMLTATLTDGTFTAARIVRSITGDRRHRDRGGLHGGVLNRHQHPRAHGKLHRGHLVHGES